MSKIAITIQARKHNYTTLRAAFRSENGAIDLASIMVGIIVIGLIGGVIAATVFAVIPWAQDNAAKQQLDSIHTAQNAHYGLSSDAGYTLKTADASTPPVRNSFSDSAGLQINSLLSTSIMYCTIPDAGGQNYKAYVLSASGNIFQTSKDRKVAKIAATSIPAGCSLGGAAGGGEPASITAVPSNLSLGLFNTMALDSTNHLWAAGYNGQGQLGDGTTVNKSTPVAVTPGRTYKKIVSSYTSTYAIDSTDHLWAWGNNGNGTLGDGTTINRLVPTAITPERTYSDVKGGMEGHAIALDTTGHLWAWGANNTGQLGDGTTVGKLVPTAINPSTVYTQISLNGGYTLALDTTGHLWVWGQSQISTPNPLVPTLVTPNQTYVQISAGSYTSLALDASGQIWSWGANTYYTLGNGSATTTKVNTPTKILVGKTFTHVSLTYITASALDSDGHLWSWGANNYGTIGNGFRGSATIDMVPNPTMVTTTKTYKWIYQGYAHAVAMGADNKLNMWGENTFGQYGNGTTSAGANVPTEATFTLP